MAHPAESPWPAIAHQVKLDLLPFPGRFGMAWRVALLCALVCCVAMIYKIPEPAISCYLVIFLMRPNSAAVIGQALGLIVLASVVVLAMAPLIQATADNPLLRIVAIAVTSFGFLYLSSASQLGETGAIIALVISFILTLIDHVPLGEVATRGLLYAWQMATMPMALMIVFLLILGTSPHRLLRETVASRLNAAADALETPGADAARRLDERLAEGNDDADQQVMLARLFHTAPSACVTWLAGAAATSYRLLIAVAALPADLSAQARVSLAQQCRSMSDAIAVGRRPQASLSPDAPAPLHAVLTAIAGLNSPNGGSNAAPVKKPFLADDAFTNPDHQRYALKTTAAAISCYFIYSLIDWQGIHTAMITCYVAALGTTGETVHKLALRIIGCLIGAFLGLASILFVIPHLTSVGGLMALVFAGVLVAGWVSSGNERISYAGVQIGLAFLLTILNGFGPSLDMDSARDRIVGILLGNIVVYVIFTQIWPKSAVVDVRARLVRALEALSRIAALDAARRPFAIGEAAFVETEVAKAADQLALIPFEPRHQRPSAERVARLDELIAEMKALLPQLMFSAEPSDDASRRLARAADLLRSESCTSAPAPESPASTSGHAEGIAWRMQRIEQLATG